MIKKLTDQGFTIAELMVAIAVLSLLLLISSSVITGIGSLFSKGINNVNTQDEARNIIQDIVSSIQFSGGNISTGTPRSYIVSGKSVTFNAVCVGTTRYSFISPPPNPPISFDHTVWVDQMQDDTSCIPLNINCPQPSPNSDCTQGTTGEELAGPNTYVNDIKVNSITANVWSVNVSLISGIPGVLNWSRSTNQYSCNPGDGQQYCATSTLNATALVRM